MENNIKPRFYIYGQSENGKRQIVYLPGIEKLKEFNFCINKIHVSSVENCEIYNEIREKRGHASGHSVLHEAIINFHIDLIELFLENGADLSLKNNENQTPIELATQLGKFEIVKLIAETINTDQEDKAGYKKALWVAAKADELEVVKSLIKAAASLNYCCPDTGNSALHEAIISSNLEMIMLLIENGANLDIKNNENQTPIELAAEYAEFEVVKLMQTFKNMPISRKLLSFRNSNDFLERTNAAKLLNDIMNLGIAPKNLLSLVANEKEQEEFVFYICGLEPTAHKYFYEFALMAETCADESIFSFKKKMYETLFGQEVILDCDIKIFDFIINTCKESFTLRSLLIQIMDKILKADKNMTYSEKLYIFLNISKDFSQDNIKQLEELFAKSIEIGNNTVSKNSQEKNWVENSCATSSSAFFAHPKILIHDTSIHSTTITASTIKELLKSCYNISDNFITSVTCSHNFLEIKLETPICFTKILSKYSDVYYKNNGFCMTDQNEILDFVETLKELKSQNDRRDAECKQYPSNLSDGLSLR